MASLGKSGISVNLFPIVSIQVWPEKLRKIKIFTWNSGYCFLIQLNCWISYWVQMEIRRWDEERVADEKMYNNRSIERGGSEWNTTLINEIENDSGDSLRDIVVILKIQKILEKNWCSWSDAKWGDSNSRVFRTNNFEWIRGIMKRNIWA